jgi:hypothetical protein
MFKERLSRVLVAACAAAQRQMNAVLPLNSDRKRRAIAGSRNFGNFRILVILALT